MTTIIDALETTFTRVLDASLQASGLILLLILLQRALRSRLTPFWRHAFWMLVVVALACPVPRHTLPGLCSVELPDFRALCGKVFGVLDGGDITGPGDHHVWANVRAVWTDEGSGPQGRSTGFLQAPSPGPGVAVLWLAGTCVFTALVLGQNVRMGGSVRRKRPVTDQATLDLLEDCKTEMAVRAPISIVETPLVKTPALFGFVRPRLLFPPGGIARLGPERLRWVFLHELAHVRRGDIPAGWLMALLQGLHWFNPLVWYGFARIRADREEACDAQALSRANREERRAYGATVIHMIETCAEQRRLPGLASMLRGDGQARQRLTAIMGIGARRSWSAATCFSLLLLIGVLSVAYAPRLTPAGGGRAPEAPGTLRPGLAGAWYGEADLRRLKGADSVSLLDLDWNNSRGRGNEWSAKWLGYLRSPVTGDVAFRVTSPMGAVLEMDGHPVIRLDGEESEGSATVRLAEGHYYPIAVSYFHKRANGDDSRLEISWRLPFGEARPVPPESIYHAPEQEYLLIEGG